MASPEPSIMSRSLVLALAVLVGVFRPAVARAQLASRATLAGPGIRLAVSTADGHVAELRDGGGRVLAGVPNDSIGLWSLDRAPGTAPIRAAQAGRFAWRRVDPRTLELTWDRFAEVPALRVVATATR